VLLEGRPENTFQVTAKDAGRLPLEGPCDLFRRIQKRDGRIVDFNPSKITEAIFKAAQSVGGKNRRRSETLTEYVILALAQSHQDQTNLLNIEMVQDCIERVMVEKGHYRTARAFITYRNERARRRALHGQLHFPSELDDGVETLLGASVATSKGDSIRWDREKIVKALVRETSLAYDEARKVSHAVELEIIHSKISHLTSPLIRELTNAKLLQMGFENERRLHARLGLPVFDVEQCLLGKEGIASVEGEILRQFALEKVLPLAVSEAHANQDLHVHDLELIHKPVTFKRDLDLTHQRAWYEPKRVRSDASDSEWTGFLANWEREESRLLAAVGKRLVWENVNSAIAFHARKSGLEIRGAVGQALEKLWRLAGHGGRKAEVVWRLSEKMHPHWRAKFIGARQKTLLPEDDIEAANRAVLLEILRQVEDAGPYWMACGVEFEVIVDAHSGKTIEPILATAIAACMSAQAPIRILFRRETAISDSRPTENAPLIGMISLNLPRAAAVAAGNESALAEWLEDRLHLATQGHLAKRHLITERLKAGALAPLSFSEKSGEGGHLLHLDKAVFGVGIWGLSEMTRIHRGESPLESEEAFKWLLKILSRIRLRMQEIGSRFGMNLQFVANPDEIVADRLIESVRAAGVGIGPVCVESLLETSNATESALVLEGKLHPFFAFGEAAASREHSQFQEPAKNVEWIQFLAAKTHVSGVTWTGRSHHCQKCGAVFGETRSVCEACGGESVAGSVRRGQGMFNKIVHL
jgi:ribonucleoside-triphosphate reductase